MPGVAPDALIFSLTSDEESSIVECEFVGLKNFVSGKKYLARLQIDTDVYTSGCYSLENGLLNITLHPKINGQPNFYWVSH
jgi:hypothetical protein